MYFIKRMSFYVIILLLLISLYKDLTIGTPLFKENKSSLTPQTNQELKFSITKVSVQSGDTVLSITEQLNHQLITLDITKIIMDFKTINPEIDPYNLQTNTDYYFPLY